MITNHPLVLMALSKKMNNRNKICFFNRGSVHYRKNIWMLMDQGLPCDFYFGDDRRDNIKPIDTSLLHNFNYIDKLDFIDLKGVELSRYKLNNTSFTDNLEEVDKLLENLKNEMNNRFAQMKKKGDLVYQGKYRICVIDGIGTISTHYDKKLKENIFNNLIELGQKGRASKVLLRDRNSDVSGLWSFRGNTDNICKHSKQTQAWFFGSSCKAS